MTMPDNSQFTEEQRTEAFRREVMQQLMAQTKSLDTVKTIMVLWLVLTIVGVVIYIAAAASSGSGY